MSTEYDVHLGDEGTLFRLTLKDDTEALNVSSATVTQIKFKKPSGEVFTKTATFTTDGADGLIEYSSETGFIDELGTWRYQAYVELPSGKWHSTQTFFNVGATI